METVHASYLGLVTHISDLRARVEQWQKCDEGSLGVAQEKLDRIQTLVGHTVWPKALVLSVPHGDAHVSLGQRRCIAHTIRRRWSIP